MTSTVVLSIEERLNFYVHGDADWTTIASAWVTAKNKDVKAPQVNS